MGYESFPNSAHNNRAISLAENEQLLTPLGLSGLIGYTGVTPVFGDSSGLQVKIRAGVRATVRGTRFNITTETTAAVGANSSGSPRIDLLVARLDRAATAPNAYTITPVVIAGTPAASPVAPSPVRNDTIDGTGYWDVPLAEIDVTNGASTITAGQVRNRAWWVCGSGYVALAASRPPVEPGVQMYEADTGITYLGTAAGAWQQVYRNSGIVQLSVPSGWTRNTFAFARVGALITMTARLVRTGADIPETTAATFGGLSDTYIPPESWYGTYHCSFPDHSSAVEINPALRQVIFHPTATAGQEIRQGAHLLTNMTWPAAN